ncbi:hypothetical protein CDIK_0138 [Cucumispora dikerogammari]|nr:hypothetical protein CDIK_0138 [Cucumispora dikerogammari]
MLFIFYQVITLLCSRTSIMLPEETNKTLEDRLNDIKTCVLKIYEEETNTAALFEHGFTQLIKNHIGTKYNSLQNIYRSLKNIRKKQKESVEDRDMRFLKKLFFQHLISFQCRFLNAMRNLIDEQRMSGKPLNNRNTRVFFEMIELSEKKNLDLSFLKSENYTNYSFSYFLNNLEAIVCKVYDISISQLREDLYYDFMWNKKVFSDINIQDFYKVFFFFLCHYKQEEETYWEEEIKIDESISKLNINNNVLETIRKLLDFYDKERLEINTFLNEHEEETAYENEETAYENEETAYENEETQNNCTLLERKNIIETLLKGLSKLEQDALISLPDIKHHEFITESYFIKMVVVRLDNQHKDLSFEPFFGRSNSFSSDED